MNTTSQLSSMSSLPTARRAPAWIAVVTTALCALGAVLWLSTRPEAQSDSKPSAVAAKSDPTLAEARAARAAAMRERMDRMHARIAKLEKVEKPSKRPAPKAKTPRARPTPEPTTPPVAIDPECLRNPICKRGR